MNLSSSSIRLFLNGFSKALSMKPALTSLPASSRANAAIGARSSWSCSSAKNATLVSGPVPGAPAPLAGKPVYSMSATRTPEVTSGGVARYTTISEPP